MSTTGQSPPPARIPERLAPFVLSMHGYAATGLTPGIHRGLPGGSLTMVFAIDDPLRTALDWDRWAAGVLQEQWTVLGGLHTRPALVVGSGTWSGVQLALHPLGAQRLFGVPAAALPTEGWDAREVLGSELDATTERLQDVSSWGERYAVILALLEARLHRSRPASVRPEVIEAWRALRVSHGRARVDDLSRRVGYSRRRLTQLFRTEVGLSPKTAARMMRFDGARHALSTAATTLGSPQPGTGLDLAGIAVRHGYYDHAHLVREFTAFSGLSPTAWLTEEFPNVQVGEVHSAAR